MAALAAEQSSGTAPELRTPRDPSQLGVPMLALWVHLTAATVEGTRKCFHTFDNSTNPLAPSAISTEPRRVAPEVVAEVGHLVDVARTEFVEDGVENSLSRGLPLLVNSHHEPAVRVLAELVASGTIGQDLIVEVLKELGRIRDPASHEARLWHLEDLLFSKQPGTRDGAGIGLSWMGDRRAAGALRSAIGRETIPQLRTDLELVLAEFE